MAFHTRPSGITVACYLKNPVCTETASAAKDCFIICLKILYVISVCLSVIEHRLLDSSEYSFPERHRAVRAG